MDCLFCKIIAGDIPAKKVYENEYVLAFEDISPMAPVHVLIIPKKHIKDLNAISKENIDDIKNVMNAIKEVAKICGVYDSGYKIISNTGRDGGQEVPHLHFHLLGGKKINQKIICE